MSRRAGPRSASDVHALMVGNPALRDRNRGNAGVMELLLPLAGGRGEAPVPAEERLAARLDPAADGLTGRERFRRLCARLLPSEMPGIGALRDEAALQARAILRCHRGVRAEGWAVLPLMVANGVHIPRRGFTRAERKTDSLPAIIGGRLKSMGMLAGAWDAEFLLWPPRSGWVEFKRPPAPPRWVRRQGRMVQERDPGGELSETQGLFREVLALRGEPHAVVATDAEFEAALLSWGVAEGE